MKFSLYFQVLIAIVAGVLLGVFDPALGAQMQPLGDAFVRLVRMLIAPIIFCTVVGGMAAMADLHKVGRTGGLALLYFEVMSTVALLVGLVVANIARPGARMNVAAASLDAGAVAAYTHSDKMKSVGDFLLNVIPSSVVEAFARGEILQVLLFAILFGFALQRLGPRAGRVTRMLDALAALLFRVVGLVMRAAPVGAFGAMAFTVGKYGFATLWPLGRLVACFYATCLLFVGVALGVVAGLHGIPILRFVRYIRDELFIVLATSSSESVLPRLIAKLEKLGAGKAVVGLVVPAGYSFNLDGTAIYLTMAALFIAQATHTPLDLGAQLSLLAVLMVTSKGAAGVAGSGFIVLAATLSSTGSLPVAGLTLILGVDRFMSEARALTNTVGNGIATLIVARWTGELDMIAMRRELGRTP